MLFTAYFNIFIEDNKNYLTQKSYIYRSKGMRIQKEVICMCYISVDEKKRAAFK